MFISFGNRVRGRAGYISVQPLRSLCLGADSAGMTLTTESQRSPRMHREGAVPLPGVVLQVAVRWISLALIVTCGTLAIFNPHRAVEADNEANQSKHPVDEETALIEQALFTRAEFFGAQ